MSFGPPSDDRGWLPLSLRKNPMASGGRSWVGVVARLTLPVVLCAQGWSTLVKMRSPGESGACATKLRGAGGSDDGGDFLHNHMYR